MAAGAVAVTLFAAPAAGAATPAATGSFIGALTRNTVVGGTVPPNGDVNPYGVAVVPESRVRSGGGFRAPAWNTAFAVGGYRRRVMTAGLAGVRIEL